MPRYLTFISSFLFALLLAGSAVGTAHSLAQSQVKFAGEEVEYTFGGPITFRARVDPPDRIAEAWVTFGARGEAESRVEPIPVITDGQIEYTYQQDSSRLQAFAPIDYHFTVQLAGGETVESETFSFDYTDNRFQWDTLNSSGFRVHWYLGGPALGQSAADVAQEGLQHAGGILTFADPGPVDIYVYASSDDLLAALPQNGIERVVGHADPDLDLIVVSLPEGPDQRLLTEQRIPHELMHILLYQKTGGKTGALPAWLNEGLASMNELYPDPDYQVLLENAQKDQSLLPVSQLCQTFPPDSSGMALAYAEATSFTRYLHRAYGTAALETLVAGYTDGLACDRGVLTAYSLSLADLDQEWQKAAFSEPQVTDPENGNLLPWIAVIAAAVAIPLIGALTNLRKPSVRKGAQGGR